MVFGMRLVVDSSIKSFTLEQSDNQSSSLYGDIFPYTRNEAGQGRLPSAATIATVVPKELPQQ